MHFTVFSLYSIYQPKVSSPFELRSSVPDKIGGVYYLYNNRISKIGLGILALILTIIGRLLIVFGPLSKKFRYFSDFLLNFRNEPCVFSVYFYGDTAAAGIPALLVVTDMSAVVGFSVLLL